MSNPNKRAWTRIEIEKAAIKLYEYLPAQVFDLMEHLSSITPESTKEEDGSDQDEPQLTCICGKIGGHQHKGNAEQETLHSEHTCKDTLDKSLQEHCNCYCHGIEPGVECCRRCRSAAEQEDPSCLHSEERCKQSSPTEVSEECAGCPLDDLYGKHRHKTIQPKTQALPEIENLKSIKFELDPLIIGEYDERYIRNTIGELVLTVNAIVNKLSRGEQSHD